MFNNEPEYEDDERASEATCKRCGKEGLEWVDTGGNPARWHLYDGMKLHVCKNAVASADDFEDLTR